MSVKLVATVLRVVPGHGPTQSLSRNGVPALARLLSTQVQHHAYWATARLATLVDGSLERRGARFPGQTFRLRRRCVIPDEPPKRDFARPARCLVPLLYVKLSCPVLVAGPLRRHLARLIAALEAPLSIPILWVATCFTGVAQMVEVALMDDEVPDIASRPQNFGPKHHFGARQLLDINVRSLWEGPLLASFILVLQLHPE